VPFGHYGVKRVSSGLPARFVIESILYLCCLWRHRRHWGVMRDSLHSFDHTALLMKPKMGVSWQKGTKSKCHRILHFRDTLFFRSVLRWSSLQKIFLVPKPEISTFTTSCTPFLPPYSVNISSFMPLRSPIPITCGSIIT
jgi:hypothetical protein